MAHDLSTSGPRLRKDRVKANRRGEGMPPLGIAIATVAFAWACQAGPAPSPDGLRFPGPDRPVAKIVASAYSTEEKRDGNGEAERVMDRLGIRPGLRAADIGAGDGYYTVRLARRLGPSASLYAQDVQAKFVKRLEERLRREGIQGVKLILGLPRDPKLPPNAVDVAILSHVYHEIENPYEFFYRLHATLAPGARVAVIDTDKPTQDHGTPPALLRCELTAVGYRQVDFLALAPADGYLAVFAPPDSLPRPEFIVPCKQSLHGQIDDHGLRVLLIVWFHPGTILETGGGTMPTLTIKNIPQDLYRRLKARAGRHHRSLNSEVIRCLEQQVGAAPLDVETMLARAREVRRFTKDFWLTDEELRAAKNEGRA